MFAQSSMFRTMFMSALLLLLAVSIGSAQGMRMSPEDQAKALKDSLTLDSTQTVKVTGILKAQQAEIMAIFQSGGDDREAMRGQMMDVRKKYDGKVDSILTDSQRKKFAEMVKNRPMGRMRPRN